MVQDIKKPIFDRFERWVRQNAPKPDVRPPFEYTVSIIYLGKILDFVWFEGDVPEDVNREFLYAINPDWPGPQLLTQDADGIGDLSFEELVFICKRLQRPDWVDAGIGTLGKLSNSEFMKRWPPTA